MSISYQGKDRQEKTLHAFLGPHEGLFLERLRINSIPESAWDIVPKRIRKKLEEDHLSVSLFLPPMDQVMDRGHVSNQQDILPILQYAVLKLCFDYYLKKLSDGQTEKQFSNDYWDDFRVFSHIQGHQSIIQSWEGFWQFQKKVQAKLKSGQSIQKQALIKAANQFLLDKPVQLPYANKTPSELIKAIQEQDAKMENKDMIYAMQKILDGNFIPILVEIPLAQSPHCFLSIRSTLLEKLKAKLLLTNDNTYNLISRKNCN